MDIPSPEHHSLHSTSVTSTGKSTCTIGSTRKFSELWDLVFYVFCLPPDAVLGTSQDVVIVQESHKNTSNPGNDQHSATFHAYGMLVNWGGVCSHSDWCKRRMGERLSDCRVFTFLISWLYARQVFCGQTFTLETGEITFSFWDEAELLSNTPKTIQFIPFLIWTFTAPYSWIRKLIRVHFTNTHDRCSSLLFRIL